MKTEMETLRERIAAVCEKTEANTQARMKALAKLKWRLESIDGLCAGLDSKFGCALVLRDNAQIFDGRDNEELKKQFYETSLGIELALVLLD